jgi:hypothetical protein
MAPNAVRNAALVGKFAASASSAQNVINIPCPVLRSWRLRALRKAGSCRKAGTIISRTIRFISSRLSGSPPLDHLCEHRGSLHVLRSGNLCRPPVGVLRKEWRILHGVVPVRGAQEFVVAHSMRASRSSCRLVRPGVPGHVTQTQIAAREVASRGGDLDALLRVLDPDVVRRAGSAISLEAAFANHISRRVTSDRRPGRSGCALLERRAAQLHEPPSRLSISNRQRR